VTPSRAFRHAMRRDYMLFIEQCFRTLNPGILFEDRWHLHAIAEKLRQVDVGDCRRLIVNVPPRSGKSIMTTIGYAAWRQGHDPRSRIICVSSDDSLVRSLGFGMALPLSADLRARIVRAVGEGSSIRQAAVRFAVSLSAAIKLMQRVRTTGRTEPARSYAGIWVTVA